MIRQRTATCALVAGMTLLASACSENREPVAPIDQPDNAQPRQSATQQASPDDPVGLARGVRGFGGFYLDKGVPTIYLSDASQRGAAQRALEPFFRSRGIDPAQLRVLRGEFDFTKLEGWFRQASPVALSVRGAVFADLDEARNRVRIGVETGAAEAQVRSAVARLGIPEGAVIVEQTAPIRFMATLRDQVRPVVAGLQINFSLFVCTLGFNAVQAAQNSFVTASHCSDKQSVVEGTEYFQPLESVAGSFIGTEVEDPPLFRGGACPTGRRCRFSDALRAAYANGVSFSLGTIARTTGPNNGSLTIAGSFDINKEASSATFVVGDVANKVGRTTGWTQGEITETCMDTNVFGSDITELCQTFVQAGVAGGDSGSDVFLRNGNGPVTLAGILWGGSAAGDLFVFSPLASIERELGPLTTF
jgi:hypothetical protein